MAFSRPSGNNRVKQAPKMKDSENDDDDDDYMSDTVLAKCSDTRPGLVSKAIARRYENEAKTEEINRRHRLENKPRRVVESEARDEGLKSALTADNRGFRLLEKMGYKPGTAIGKRGTGKLEPVPIEIKADRGGLGREADARRRLEERNAMRATMALKRRRCEDEWRREVRARHDDREAQKHLRASQSVCAQLDADVGELAAPERAFFWPAALLPCADDDAEDFDDESDVPPAIKRHKNENESDDEGEPSSSKTGNDWDAAADDEDALLTTSEKLQILTHYLRNTYWYCVWCGTRHDDDDDMSQNCPGDTADVHE